MCMLSYEAEHICNTNILVAKVYNYPVEGEDNQAIRQLTVYSNSIGNTNKDNIMILAVPHPESVEYIDLSDYQELFDDIYNDFVDDRMITDSIKNSDTDDIDDAENGELKITEVGSFLACTMKSLSDHSRLPRDIFPPLSSSVLKFLSSKYPSTVDNPVGFVICKLKLGDVDYHPFAYTHRCYTPTGELFIPTMHYHPKSGSFFSRIWNSISTKSDIVDDWDHNIYILNRNEEAVRKMKETYQFGGAYRSRKWIAGRCSLQVDKLPTNIRIGNTSEVEHFAYFSLTRSYDNVDIVV